MRKMCQSQQFVTWDTGCRLLSMSHGRSKYVIQASVTPAQTFAPQKLKPDAVENVFCSLELELGTYINLHSFESSMK